MGEALHEIVREREGTRCRIYAPVGAHRDLLAYLVRRLLENGANSSFVNQIVDKDLRARGDRRRPGRRGRGASAAIANPGIRRPAELFAPRRNSRGWNVNEPASIAGADRRARALAHATAGRPRRRRRPAARPVINPADPSDVVGDVAEATRRGGRRRARRRAGGLRRLVGAAAGRARRRAAPRRRPLRGERRRADRARDPRGRQDARRRHRRGARGGRLPALLRRRRRGGRPARRAACSSASAPGTSRWRSSPARSPPASAPATR